MACGAVVVLASARQPETTSLTSAASTTAEANAASRPSAGGAQKPPPASDVTTEAAHAKASCTIPDRGAGPYGEWQRLALGKVLHPQQISADHYDVLLHFHGAEAIRKVVAPMGFDNLVIVALDAGEGSSRYSEAFYAGAPLEDLLEEVGRPLRPARLRHLIVSSWSAGYGAVRELLQHEPLAPNAVILLDSAHASYSEDGITVQPEGYAPFLSFARRALAGEVPMVLTHSDIRPPGYASTTEVAGALLHHLGGRRSFAGLTRHYGVEAKSQYQAGSLIVRGYSGTGKPAHCAHLRMLADILRDDVLPALDATAAAPPAPSPSSSTP